MDFFTGLVIFICVVVLGTLMAIKTHAMELIAIVILVPLLFYGILWAISKISEKNEKLGCLIWLIILTIPIWIWSFV